MSKPFRLSRSAMGFLFLFGALLNAALLTTGTDYSTVADGAFIDYVRDTWRDVVAPNMWAFGSILIVFEGSVGILIHSGGRRTLLGLAGAGGFHVGLMFLGWGFWLWSIPLLVVLAWLIVGTVRELGAPARHLRVVDRKAA